MKNLKIYFVVLLSLLCAIILSIFPLPDTLKFFRPNWLILFIGFWVFALPGSIGVWTAWLFGFLLDVLFNTPLGLQAFISSFACYLAIRIQRNMRQMDFFKQFFLIMLISLIALSFQFIIEGILGQNPLSFKLFFPISANMLFWPLIYFLLKKIQNKYGLFFVPS